MAPPATAAASAAVLLKIHPCPRSLHETRQILRILQGHGEVIAFRSLRQQYPIPKPDQVIALFAYPSSASSFIAASPHRLKIEPTPHPSSIHPVYLRPAHARDPYASSSASTSPHPSTLPGIPLPVPTTTRRPEKLSPMEEKLEEGKGKDLIEVEIVARLSDSNHKFLIASGPYYGPFTPDLRTMQAADLLKGSQVPNVGLADWLGALGREKRPGSAQEMRLLRKRREGLLAGRVGLRELWERGMRKKRADETGKAVEADG
ncbi:MAG: hypothetical protein M1837_001524 [Sclerophora amabilis]|nr:MAG: hypothetical protein M1837_001524 [Sclerophora amabilis]